MKGVPTPDSMQTSQERNHDVIREYTFSFRRASEEGKGSNTGKREHSHAVIICQESPYPGISTRLSVECRLREEPESA